MKTEEHIKKEKAMYGELITELEQSGESVQEFTIRKLAEVLVLMHMQTGACLELAHSMTTFTNKVVLKEDKTLGGL